jgi:hypothetical protein
VFEFLLSCGGDVHLIIFRSDPALSFVPEALPPPNGWFAHDRAGRFVVDIEIAGRVA